MDDFDRRSSQMRTLTERMDDFDRRLKLIEDSVPSTKPEEKPLVDVTSIDDLQF